MGLRDLKKRLTASVEDLEASRLQDRYAGLGHTPVNEIVLRRPVRVGGEISRLKVVPRAGSPTIEAVVSDGTGDVTAVFTGRRSIGGMHPGRGVLLEGVAFDERGRKVLLNPAYTLLD